MQVSKLIKIVTVFSIHIVWCILIFVYQLLITYKVNYTQAPYNLNLLFSNAEGIKKGTPVNYKGVNIGQVLSINLHTDYVIVLIRIESSKILIPLNAYVKIHKTILMSDTTLYIHNKQLKFLSSSANVRQLSSNFQYQSTDSFINHASNFCQHNDFIYGFQGTNLDDLVDIFVRLSIQLDNTDIVDTLYNLIQNCNELLNIVQQELLKKI